MICLEMRGDEGRQQRYRVAAGGAPVALNDDTVWPGEFTMKIHTLRREDRSHQAIGRLPASYFRPDTGTS